MIFPAVLLLLFNCSFWTHAQELHNTLHERKHTKRIIYGTPITQMKPYDVVRYIVFISNGHHTSTVVLTIVQPIMLGFFHDWLEALKYDYLPNPEAGNLVCGGSLITEFIVQTACHCLINGVSTLESSVRPEVKNSYENYYALYMGSTFVANFTRGVRAKRFIAHQKCEWITGAVLSHDFGLIVAKESVLAAGGKGAKITPLYSIAELSRGWYHVQNNLKVCLFVGWGRRWEKVHNKDIDGAKAEILQHGWRLTKDYLSCANLLYRRLNQHHFKSLLKNYTEVGTWVCHFPFGKQRGDPRPGDSGGPVTCDNNYFAVISSGGNKSTFEKQITSISVSQPIAFNVFENAAEYRDSITKLTTDYNGPDSWPTFRPARVDLKSTALSIAGSTIIVIVLMQFIF